MLSFLARCSTRVNGGPAILTALALLSGCSSTPPDDPEAECEIVGGGCPSGCREIFGSTLQDDLFARCVEKKRVLLGCSRVSETVACEAGTSVCVRTEEYRSYEVDLCDPPWPDSLRERFDDCEAAPSCEDREAARAELDALDAEIRERVSAEGCGTADDCGVLGMGHKACGGPHEYVVYSKLGSDEADLVQRAEKLEQSESAYNRKYSISSDCSTPLPLELQCTDNGCWGKVKS